MIEVKGRYITAKQFTDTADDRVWEKQKRGKWTDEMKYKINDFAKISGVSAANIRFYEKKGYPQPERTETGYRQFDIEDVYRSNTFNSLLSQGFTVSEAIDRLTWHDTDDYCEALIRNNERIEKEIWMLRERLEWNRKLHYVYSHAEEELETIREITLPQQCFLHCTCGEDLTPSLSIGLVEEWMDMLPVCRFASVCTEKNFEMGFVMDYTTAHISHLDGPGTSQYDGGVFYAFLYNGDETKTMEDPRVQKLFADGYILKEPFLRIYLMVGTKEYGEYMHYVLLRK